MRGFNLSREYNGNARQKKNPDRILMLTGPITDDLANAVIADLLEMDAENPNKPIQMYIHSPGGSVTAGLAIYDTMMHIKAPVHTIGLGMCASMASFLLAAGNPGNRFILPSASDMIHQPSGGTGGRAKATEVEVDADEMRKIKRRMEMLYAHFLKIPYDDEFSEMIKDVMHEDSYFNATMALKLGLVDQILPPKDTKARDSDFKVVMDINQMEYDEIGPGSPKNQRIAKKLIEARERYLAEQAQVKSPNLRLAANQP